MKFAVAGTVPQKPTFQGICHEMYKNFGGAHRNLLALCKTQADKNLLVAQLHELRGTVRAQFDQVKEVQDGE